MQVIKRRKHYTDVVKDVTKPSKRTRVIKTYSNFQNHLGQWGESIPNIVSQVAEPPAWSGAYDFDRASLNAPLQFFARDAMDVGNRAMVGVRLSDEPSKWFNIKADNIDNSVDVTSIDDKTVQWTNLWTDTNYRVTHHRHKLKVDFVLTGSNHPSSFTETVKLAPGLTLVDNGNNTLSVMDGEREVFNMPAPFGYVEGDITQDPVVGVTMTKGAKQGVFETIIITPNASDLASVGYANNIVIDPTASITSATDLDDNFVWSANVNNNYGSNNTFKASEGATPLQREIFRVQTSALPAGTYSRVEIFVASGFGSTVTIKTYRITDANGDWVEGTVSATTQTGSSCYNYKAYNTDSWAGSAGLRTSGTDYNATSYGSASWTVSYPTYFSVESSPTWFEEFRDGTNAGIMFGNLDSGTNLWSGFSADDGSYPLYVEIDYSATAADNSIFFSNNF